MKLNPKMAAFATNTTSTRAQPFKQLLAEAKADLLKTPKTAVPAKPSATVTSQKPGAKAQVVSSSVSVSGATSAHANATVRRVHLNAEAQRLGSVRADHSVRADSLATARTQHAEAIVTKSDARVIDFILKELKAENSNHTAPPPAAAPAELATVHQLHPVALTQPTKPEATNEAKASQAVALIEKIETFVKSQRPGLALTLNNSLGAHVEIERIGPKEIALKLIGHRGPPTPEAVSRIREELRARGLKIGALSVA